MSSSETDTPRTPQQTEAGRFLLVVRDWTNPSAPPSVEEFKAFLDNHRMQNAENPGIDFSLPQLLKVIELEIDHLEAVRGWGRPDYTAMKALQELISQSMYPES